MDDVILTDNDLSCITNLKAHLHSIFGIKDLGILHYFLGLEVNYMTQGIALTQHKYTKELLQNSGITSFKSVATPLP